MTGIVFPHSSSIEVLEEGEYRIGIIFALTAPLISASTESRIMYAQCGCTSSFSKAYWKILTSGLGWPTSCDVMTRSTRSKTPMALAFSIWLSVGPFVIIAVRYPLSRSLLRVWMLPGIALRFFLYAVLYTFRKCSMYWESG